jgi:hypothetical protein
VGDGLGAMVEFSLAGEIEETPKKSSFNAMSPNMGPNKKLLWN